MTRPRESTTMRLDRARISSSSVEINSSTFSAGGDSGSSIWVYNGTGAVITGILSYGSSSTTGFSPWGGVVSELGALTVQ